MGYIGLRDDNAGYYRTLDSLTASFNGSTTVFPLTYSSGIPLSVVDARQLVINLNGQILEPNVAFTVSGTNITFAAAPAAATPFWGILLGGVYSTLNPEIADANFVSSTYDETFEPFDSLATILANTSAYTDSSTKVATTNFVKYRSVPYFRYNSTLPATLSNGVDTTVQFTDGNLTSSQNITGLAWASNELTFPTSLYGLWAVDVSIRTGTNGSSNIAQALLAWVEIWNGSTWVPHTSIVDLNTGTFMSGVKYTAHTYGILRINGSNTKIRVRMHTANHLGWTLSMDAYEFSGFMLGGL